VVIGCFEDGLVVFSSSSYCALFVFCEVIILMKFTCEGRIMAYYLHRQRTDTSTVVYTLPVTTCVFPQESPDDGLSGPTHRIDK
jgi:hypothetical protein